MLSHNVVQTDKPTNTNTKLIVQNTILNSNNVVIQNITDLTVNLLYVTKYCMTESFAIMYKQATLT